jgi:hypothetical protein
MLHGPDLIGHFGFEVLELLTEGVELSLQALLYLLVLLFEALKVFLGLHFLIDRYFFPD